MRLLHAGPDHVRRGVDRRRTHTIACRDSRMDERQYLPLFVLSSDRRRGCCGSRAEGRLMLPFSYGHASEVSEAVATGHSADAAFLAGGTELLNWLTLGMAKPRRLIVCHRHAW